MKLFIISFVSNNLFIISKIYSEVISDEMNKIVFLFLIVAFNKNTFIIFFMIFSFVLLLFLLFIFILLNL